MNINELATTIAATLDISDHAAEAALTTYIGQIEQLEDREIDTDDIAEADAKFLIGAIQEAKKAGDLGDRELADLEEAAEQYDLARNNAEHHRQVRNNAVVKAVQAGAPRTEVARAAGITLQAVRDIMSH